MSRRNELATTKAEETRERILASALELFRARGFDATMRDVAAEAGVATASKDFPRRLNRPAGG